MKILRQLLVTILAIVIILLITGVVAVSFFADRAVKYGIEKGGSAVLPVAVKVGDVDVRILSGKLVLHDLIIENPTGYKHKNLLELESVSVEVDIRSLLSDTIEIKQIKIDGAVVVLEQRDLIHNNIKDILKAIPTGKEAEKGPAAEGKKLHIEELIISNTTVKVKLLPLPGKIGTISLKLGTIRMTDLGGDNKLNTAKLITTILSAISRGIVEQGKGILPDDLVNGISGALGKTVGLGKEIIKGGAEAGKKILQGAGGATKKILDGAGDVGKGIGEGLKKLNPFKKKKEE